MTREKILDRIAKLLRLSANNNSVEEAALAASRAQELMLEHQIAHADLETEMDDRECELEELVVDSCLDGQKLMHWRASLWYGICHGHNCVGYTRRGSGQSKSRLTAVGRTSNVETCLYMYRWLTAEIDKLAKKAVAAKSIYDRGDARRFGNSFRVGAANEIAQRLRDKQQAVYAKAERAGKSTALVLVKNDTALVKREAPVLMAKLGRRVRSGGYRHGGGVSDLGGFHAGRSAARAINLGGNKQLGNSKKLLR